MLNFVLIFVRKKKNHSQNNPYFIASFSHWMWSISEFHFPTWYLLNITIQIYVHLIQLFVILEKYNRDFRFFLWMWAIDSIRHFWEMNGIIRSSWFWRCFGINLFNFTLLFHHNLPSCHVAYGNFFVRLWEKDIINHFYVLFVPFCNTRFT